MNDDAIRPRYIDKASVNRVFVEELGKIPDVLFIKERAEQNAAWEAIMRCAKGVSAIPVADVVKVVRCKDCRFWKTETEPIGIECEPGEHAHYCDMNGMITRTFDFCSYGYREITGKAGEKGENRI